MQPQTVVQVVWWVGTGTIGLLSSIVWFLIVRAVNKIDQNQSKLFEMVNKLSAQLNLLQGEHRAAMQMCRGKDG